jgi:hypothetical protein
MATWQHLRSSTANKRPTTSLADGRIAINTNTASPGLFFKDSAGTGIVKVGPVHVGTTAPNATPAVGGSTGNYTGEQWLDTSVSPAQMKVWNGSTWVGVVADELPVSKLQDGAARQLIQTDAAGTGVEWTSNVDVPGTLDVTSTATFDSIAQHPVGSAGAPTITFTGDTNTGIYSPGADQVAVATNGTGRLFIDSSGNVSVGDVSPNFPFCVVGTTTAGIGIRSTTDATRGFELFNNSASDTAYVSNFYNGPIVFQTNNTERMRLTSTGLGIGTSAPADILHIGGSSNQQIRVNGSGAPIYIGSANSILNLAVNRRTSDGAIPDATKSAAYINLDGSGSSSEISFLTASAINTQPTVKAVIDGSGRVGIGTTSAGSYNSAADNLVVADSGSGGITIATGTSNYGSIYFADGTSGADQYRGVLEYNHSNNAMAFFTDGSERFRCDSSGRLLVGTSSAPTSGQGQYSKLVVQGNSSGSGAGYFAIQRTSASTLIDDVEGVLSFNDNSGNTFAQIICATDATPGTGDYPGRLVFSTTADGASSPTERARITNAGYFKATSTGDYYGVTSGYHESRTGLANNVSHLFSHSASTGAVYGIQISYAQNKGTSTGDQYIYCNDSAAVRMEVRGNGGIANYSGNNVNLSDRNAKKDISPASDTWDCIKEWEIVNYRYKDQPDDADLNLGVVAQQVAESCPEVITVFQEAKEATEDQPAQEERLGVKEQQMYWMAIKALQEAQVRIEQLEQRLTDAGIA